MWSGALDPNLQLKAHGRNLGDLARIWSHVFAFQVGINLQGNLGPSMVVRQHSYALHLLEDVTYVFDGQ